MHYAVSLPNFDAHWHPRTLANLARDAGDITPEMLSDMAAYIRQHRTSETPHDLVVAGRTSGDDHVSDAEIVARYAAAGANWWVEDVAMWRYRPWEPWQEPYIWPDAELRERIRHGPPRR